MAHKSMILQRLILYGFIFVVIFSLRYSVIDDHLYTVRDDGAITMSVGRHLVDYGFIGVSPSGPIVEASSSPLQTILYASAYWVLDVGYADFAFGQTIVATFLLGVAFGLFFETSLLIGAVLASGAALTLSFVYPFFLWHGSGMENATTHVLALLSLAGLTLMVRTGRLNYLWSIPIVLLSFSRFELVVPIAAILFFFVIFWRAVFSSWSALTLSVLVAAMWALVNAARITYFGAFFPNTAIAQEIAPFDRLVMILSGSFQPFNEAALILKKNILVGGWGMAIGALLILAFRPLTREFRFLFFVTSIFFVSTILLQSLLGLPRIDIARTSSHLAPVSVLLVLLALSALASGRSPAAYLGVALFTALAAQPLLVGQPYYLGWSTQGFDRTRQTFLRLSEQNQLPRPLVSNPDLGVMSWHKSFNILDLGMLGSPVVAGLADEKELSDYVLGFAQPDFIEAHGYWTKKYCGSIFPDPRFAALYVLEGEKIEMSTLCTLENPPKSVWVRRDIVSKSESAERRFIDDLQRSLHVDVIEGEIAACGGTGAECRYVVRTIFRFIPELRENGEFDDVLSLVDDPAARDYLSGWRDSDAPRRLAAHFRKGE